jgi:c-di-GMP-binding flagellar brake protein YcgR
MLGTLFRRVVGRESHGSSFQLDVIRERRSTLRILRAVKLTAELATGESFQVSTFDFSLGGMSVTTEKPLNTGDQIIIHAPYPRNPRARFAVQVGWCRQIRSKYRVGLTFVTERGQPLSDAAQFLLDECQLSLRGNAERRRTPRIKLDRTRVTVTVLRSTPFEAHCVDLSVTGILLFGRHEVKVDTPVKLELHLGGPHGSFKTVGMVVRCKTAGLDQTYEIAIAFKDRSEESKQRLVTYLAEAMGMSG